MCGCPSLRICVCYVPLSSTRHHVVLTQPQTPPQNQQQQALAHALATWAGPTGNANTTDNTLHAHTSSSDGLDAAASTDTAALVAACRAPLLEQQEQEQEQLAAASAAYQTALVHPKLGTEWVDGWREWAEVLWLQGRRAAAKRCLEAVVDRFGPERLGPGTTVGGWMVGVCVSDQMGWV